MVGACSGTGTAVIVVSSTSSYGTGMGPDGGGGLNILSCGFMGGSLLKKEKIPCEIEI